MPARYLCIKLLPALPSTVTLDFGTMINISLSKSAKNIHVMTFHIENIQNFKAQHYNYFKVKIKHNFPCV
jgi:hypothetical protein